MQFFKSFTALTLSACLLFSAADAFAQKINEAGAAEQELATQFPAQSIDSVERARAALALVPVARAEIDRRIAYQRAKCYEEFFTSSCLNDLRDRERRANRAVRRVEVEANALLRRERAAERDRAVADRERRAAEQRAKSISITGTARNAENPDADNPEGDKPNPGSAAEVPATAPAEPVKRDESRP